MYSDTLPLSSNQPNTKYTGIPLELAYPLADCAALYNKASNAAELAFLVSELPIITFKVQAVMESI